MVHHKCLDQYLTSGKVSTSSIKCVRRYRLLKTLTKIFNIKYLQSVTLISRSLRGVRMVQHQTIDQSLPSWQVLTRSIPRFRRYRLLKNFNPKLLTFGNVNTNADADNMVSAIALPVLSYKRAKRY